MWFSLRERYATEAYNRLSPKSLPLAGILWKSSQKVLVWYIVILVWYVVILFLSLNFFNYSFNIFQNFNIALRSESIIEHQAIQELRFFTKWHNLMHCQAFKSRGTSPACHWLLQCILFSAILKIFKRRVLMY